MSQEIYYGKSSILKSRQTKYCGMGDILWSRYIMVQTTYRSIGDILWDGGHIIVGAIYCSSRDISNIYCGTVDIL